MERKLKNMIGLNYNRVTSKELHENGLELFGVDGFLKQSLRVYKEGIQEPFFFDFDCLTENPLDIEKVIRLYFDKFIEISKKATDKIDCLYFIDKEGMVNIGAIKLSALLSHYTELPNLILRPEHQIITAKIKVSSINKIQKYAIGALITDHITTGKEILNSIKILEQFGSKISYVIAFTAYKRDFKFRDEIEKKKVQIKVCYYIDTLAKKYNISELPEELKKKIEELSNTFK